MATEKTNCLIIGSGPAGYTAAIYASRANIGNILFEGNQPGGQLTITTEIENFPGFPDGIDGNELMGQMRAQAVRMGSDIREGVIESIDLSSQPFKASTDSGDTIEADSVIVATGASARYLGLSDEKKYAGMGVSACATCDGFFYRKKTVAVVGGGDTACEEATYLASLAKKVYVLVRKDYLRASQAMQQRLQSKENVEILFKTNLVGLFGENGVEGARIVHDKGEATERFSELEVDGVFLAIGHKPNTEFLAGQIELDKEGYIITKGTTTATNVEGVFAAGDVADPRYRQAVSAAGMGCHAALDVQHYLMDKNII